MPKLSLAAQALRANTLPENDRVVLAPRTNHFKVVEGFLFLDGSAVVRTPVMPKVERTAVVVRRWRDSYRIIAR